MIGARPIHLTTREERQQKIPLDALRIDVGPGRTSKVKLGDRAVFATRFQRSGPSLMAKALDNRLGVVTLIELLKHAPAGYRPAGGLHRPGGDRPARGQSGRLRLQSGYRHRPGLHACQ